MPVLVQLSWFPKQFEDIPLTQFNCHANFPNDEVVPYVVQWEKRGSDTPIFIW